MGKHAEEGIPGEGKGDASIFLCLLKYEDFCCFTIFVFYIQLNLFVFFLFTPSLLVNGCKPKKLCLLKPNYASEANSQNIFISSSAILYALCVDFLGSDTASVYFYVYPFTSMGKLAPLISFSFIVINPSLGLNVLPLTSNS